MDKKELRKKIKEISLTDEYITYSDKEITKKVLALKEFKEAKVIFTFVGMGNEPDTKEIIEEALLQGKKVAVPKCLTDSLMEVYEISSLDDLKEGMYGILEPREGLRKVKKAEVDFGLIPCVTCDKFGNRLGHGKGYYDRYLEDAKFFTCLVCRAKIMSDKVPVDENDVKLDIVITD
ncbi:MAG: 5-formyltetrahydrofolate cyclo-ligase [Clostridia bacterium]|nr:5-formyltetrahydrofolate cyclo-ligase [Clostridia bacterium]